MIHGMGTDIFETERMAKLVARGRAYLDTIFTETEITYCESKARPSEHYAARYAAKEAVLKALGTGWRDGLAFSDIEIRNDELGRPQVNLQGRVKEFCDRQQITRALISLSHTREIAIAVAILEK
ncbi:MAG: holo-ACP synthase [Anaerolineales bacterium]|nr:holo-ACP synthase [Anaerolineales bacterium]